MVTRANSLTFHLHSLVMFIAHALMAQLFPYTICMMNEFTMNTNQFYIERLLQLILIKDIPMSNCEKLLVWRMRGL